MNLAPSSQPLALLEELIRQPDASARAALLSGRPDLSTPESVEHLCNEARKIWRVDTRRALDLAAAALSVAERLNRPELLARSWRTLANALYFRGQNAEALEAHAKALALFQELGALSELARTLSASIQPLILLGEYDRAHQAAAQARELFTQQNDERRLANLEINVGNLSHRQDRFPEALACYDRAYQCYLHFQDVEGMAVAMHNSAVSLISVNDFPKALDTYQRSHDLAQQHGMSLLAAQADYNIAYLHFLRGEYGRAIQMLNAVRRSCEEVGDRYHLALSYLDQSEIYLELNLSREAEEMAGEAAERFEALGMGYENAKAIAFQAMAIGQQGKSFRATELFEISRAKFVQEQNQVWPWLIDLYRGVILFHEGRLFEARRLCAGALEFFRASPLAGKAILCQLVLAQLSLRTGNAAAARRECEDALERLVGQELPALAFQANFLMGQIAEAAGQGDAAYPSYLAAREALESLRSSLRGEELKIAFMKNKLEVYEALVDICVRRDAGDSSEEAFRYMEQAKSRSLMDLLFSGSRAFASDDPGQSALVRQVRNLREELNWYYHRIEQEHLRTEEKSPERIQLLQEQARIRENEFLRALQEAPSNEPEFAAMRPSATASVEAVQAALQSGAALLEYFSVRERFYAAFITKEQMRIVPLTPVSRVRELLRLLQFQLSKFRLGGEYVATFQQALLEATNAHLSELYEELLRPLLQNWQGQHLIVVPHGVLHYLPFHALFDGNKYVIDALRVSYAPSATIYEHCHQKTANQQGSCLILGIPDAKAPFILDEVQAVASSVASPELFVGERATIEVLKEKGTHSRMIHIAAHGNFREDNPMFSSIRLGGSFLSLYDLYNLRLPAELVTLSGCATGLNAIASGDELLGLTRGLLFAGAQSLLLTLWDVHDRSAAQFMKAFYASMQKTGDKAKSLQSAMFNIREKHPHPYFWAPFLLIGKVFPAN